MSTNQRPEVTTVTFRLAWLALGALDTGNRYVYLAQACLYGNVSEVFDALIQTY